MTRKRLTSNKPRATGLCAALLLVLLAGGPPPEPGSQCSSLSAGGVVMSDGAVFVAGQSITGVSSSDQFTVHFGTIHCLSSNAPATCVGDIDGSAAVNAADLALLLGSWGPCPGCAADLNGDDAVNAADLALLLGNWGEC